MTTDLFGDPIPDPPAMNAPLPWRVFQMDDCDWWLARSLDEAKADYMRGTGYNADDLKDARELTDEELDRLTFIENWEEPRSKWIRRPFREELDRRIAAGVSKPELFACTEY